MPEELTIMNEGPSIHEKIMSSMDSLSPQLRLAAGYVANHPDEIASRSLRYNANAIELTPPTFSRLARALGFEKYENLRDACRGQVKHQRLMFAEKAKALQEGKDTGKGKSEFLVRHGAVAIENISTFLNTVDPGQMEDISRLLAQARRVLLVGMMSSRPFVDYMEYMASMAFENWRVLGGESTSHASMLTGIERQDVVLVIAHAPYAKGSIEMAQASRDMGAKVIGITDSVMSPLAAVADTSLIVGTDSPQFFSSHVATLVLIESIIGMTVAMSGKSARTRIATVELASHKMGEYWST